MQAIMETIFDSVYLVVIIMLGCTILKNAGGKKESILVGWTALILGGGDSFHLIPRIYALWAGGITAHSASLGVGKLITSITMTVFYVLLYEIGILRYRLPRRLILTGTIYVLAILRIALCLFPQNAWLSADAPLSWGIYRNIPFTIIGLILICFFAIETNKYHDSALHLMCLAISLSFIFYIPVVLFADQYPLIGILMLPKTCMYVWMILQLKTALKTG
jgi:hypothetical protein